MKHAATDRPTAGLTPPRLRVLRAIIEAGDAANLSEIADALGLCTSRVQAIASWLYGHGLLDRDTRVYLGRYHPTEAGKKICEESAKVS